MLTYVVFPVPYNGAKCHIHQLTFLLFLLVSFCRLNRHTLVKTAIVNFKNARRGVEAQSTIVSVIDGVYFFGVIFCCLTKQCQPNNFFLLRKSREAIWFYLPKLISTFDCKLLCQTPLSAPYSFNKQDFILFLWK